MPTVEENRINALRRLAEIRQQSLKSGKSFGKKVYDSGFGGFNRGVTKMLGLPVDLMTAGLNKLGADIEDPVGGSNHLEELLYDLNMLAYKPGEEADIPALARVTEEVGAAAIPFGVTGSIARTSATGGRFGAPILEAFRSSPRMNAVGELSAAVGAGTGAAIANEIAPESQTAEMAGQLIGGFLNPSSIALGSYSAAKQGSGRLEKIVDPLLPGGAKRAAARQLQRVVDNPGSAARKLSQPIDAVPGARLTPAEETGDAGLLALQGALRKANPDFAQHVDDSTALTSRAIRADADSMAGTGRGQTREFLQGRVDDIASQIDDRINNAAKTARDRIRSVEPGTPREELNRIARDEIEKAMDQAKKIESDAWSKVPENVKVDITDLKKQYREIVSSLKRVQKDDLPPSAKRYFVKDFDSLDGTGGDADYRIRLLADIDNIGDIDTLGEIQALRSGLLDDARKAMAGETQNRNMARLADKMQEATLEVMKNSRAGPELDEALAASRTLNQKFRKGPIGKLLGFDRQGSPSSPPEVTLERLLTKDGPQGAVNMEAMLRAVDSPDMRASAEDFMRQRFINQVTDKDGNVTPGAAERFIRSNREVLERMPEVRKQIASAKSAEELASRTKSTLETRMKSVLDKRKSRAALYLDAPVDREIQAVLRSKDPASNMRALVQMSKKDPTGEALKGVKAQFVDELLRSAETRSGTLSGRDMEAFIEANGKVIRQSGLFNADEISRIKRMVDTAKRMDSGLKSGKSLDDILDESPDALTDLVARIVGASIGAQGAGGAVGAPLVAAHAGSKFVRRLTNKLPFEKTRDVLAMAMTDRNVMRDLLTRIETPQQANALQRRMNAWAASLFAPEENLEDNAEPKSP